MRNLILLFTLLVSGFMSAQTFDFSCEASASASYEALGSGYEITIVVSNINHFGEGLDINVEANGSYLTDFTGEFIDTNTFTFTVNPLETTSYSIEISGGDPESIFANATIPSSSGKSSRNTNRGLTIVTTSIAFDISVTGLNYDNWDDAYAILSTSSGTASATETDFLGLSLSDTIKVWANIGNGGIPFAEYDQIELDGVVYDFNPIVEGEANQVVLTLFGAYAHADFTDEDGNVWTWNGEDQTYTCSGGVVLTVSGTGITNSIGDEWLLEDYDGNILQTLQDATFGNCF